MTIETLNLSSLKQVKNTVIGNPSAKAALAGNQGLIQSLVHCLNQPAPPPGNDLQASQTNVRIEAAHVLSSLSYGSQNAVASLLNANAMQACLLAMSQFTPQDPLNLKAAFTRCLRSLAVAVSDVVGPSQWGLRHEGSAIRHEAIEALDYLFNINSLDVYLPLLDSTPQLSISIAQLISSAVRTPEHRNIITEWLPPSDRMKESKGKRGWEKPTAVNSNAPSRQGGWVARSLTALLRSRDSKLQEATLYALASLAKDNDKVAVLLSKVVPDRNLPSPFSTVLSLVKSRSTDVQLAACLCATHVIRASSSPHAFPGDELYIRNILSVLNRMISSTSDSPLTRGRACFVLYNLISDDTNLCQFAQERGSLEKLIAVVQNITPLEPPPEWDEDEPESLSSLREAALVALAAISLFDDDIRRKITDDFQLLPYIHVCISHRHVGVRYAACQCIRALSRSVSVMRTTLYDSDLGLKMLEILMKDDEDRRVTSAALAAVCNLLIDFSPLRQQLLDRSVLPRLVQLLNSEDPNLRLSALWAFKNLVLKTSLSTKIEIMSHFGWATLVKLLSSDNHDTQEQAFNVLRNLAEDEAGIDLIFREMNKDVLLDTINDCMSSSDPAMENVVLHAVCSLKNLFNGSDHHQLTIASHPNVLRSLRQCLAHTKAEIRRPAVDCILEIARSSAANRKEIIDAGIVMTLRHICEWTGGVPVSPSGGRTSLHPVIEDDKFVVELARQALQAFSAPTFLPEIILLSFLPPSPPSSRHGFIGTSTGTKASVRAIQTSADTTELHHSPSDPSQPLTVKLHQDSFRSYQCDTPDLEVQVTKDDLLTMYKQMQTMRRMEMAADALYKAKMIRGFCHLAIGQEAVSVGLEQGITPTDKVITAYRCHPFAVLRGGTIKGVIGELLGRQAGMSNGKGGSMHIFTPTFFGGNGIVGAQVPVGAGIAFAEKYLERPNATFAMYGDGASNQGQVFEAFNMAKLWNLPCVFVCENNKYGMGTSAERSSSNTEYFTRGDKIPGIQANGMDIIAVRQAVQYARKWTVEDKKGPLLLEFVTYRYGGHSMSDPGTTYRTREEVQRMRSTQDPIRGLQRYIEEWGVASEQELKQLDKEAKAEVDQAVEEAKASPEPLTKDLWTDIYYKGTEPPFMRGREREECWEEEPITSNFSPTHLHFHIIMAFILREIPNPTEAQLMELSSMAAAAFEGDSFLLAAVGNDPTLNVSYHRAQMIAAAIAGKIVVAEDLADRSIIGVALWFPPGSTMFASEEQDRIAFQPFLKRCPPSIQSWWNDHFLVEHPKSCQRMFGRHLLNKAWQLELVAIAPGHQGQGIGSALVRDGQQRIAQRKLIYLDTQTEQNVKFYQRLGFVLRGRYEFNSSSSGMFPLFCMTAAKVSV
ncbi:hypothetical protein ONZ45_g602 [Pleurotus djamor]|nr:hypothetical protein ONZ45_g602 [Pleurotus djamor]